jgi:hypothetical protein
MRLQVDQFHHLVVAGMRTTSYRAIHCLIRPEESVNQRIAQRALDGWPQLARNRAGKAVAGSCSADQTGQAGEGEHLSGGLTLGIGHTRPAEHVDPEETIIRSIKREVFGEWIGQSDHVLRRDLLDIPLKTQEPALFEQAHSELPEVWGRKGEAGAGGADLERETRLE